MTNATNFFSNTKLLTNLLFPFLNGKELGRIRSVNKVSDQSAKVDALWESLCGKWEGLLSTPLKGLWRYRYIYEQNCEQGIYRELVPIIYDTSMDLVYKRKHSIIEIKDETIKIYLFDVNEEILLNAPNFKNRKKFLKNIFLGDKNLALIKTQEDIQIYDKKSGNCIRVIPLTESDWKLPDTFTCNDKYVVSVDDEGKVLRTWEMQTGNLIWEKKFNTARKTYLLKFTGKQELIWSSNEHPMMWIDIEPRLISSHIEKIQRGEKSKFQINYTGTSKFSSQQRNIRIDKALNNLKSTTQRSEDYWSHVEKLETIPNPCEITYEESFMTYTIELSSNLNVRFASFVAKEDKRIGFSLLKFNNTKTLKCHFFKLINNFIVKKGFVAQSRMMLCGTRLSPDGGAPSDKVEVIVLDFNPLAKPCRNPEHIEESKLMTTRFPKVQPVSLSNPSETIVPKVPQVSVVTTTETIVPKVPQVNVVTPTKTVVAKMEPLSTDTSITIWQRILLVVRRVFSFVFLAFNRVVEIPSHILRGVYRIF